MILLTIVNIIKKFQQYVSKNEGKYFIFFSILCESVHLIHNKKKKYYFYLLMLINRISLHIFLILA